MRELREAAGLTQAKIAKSAGVSRNAVTQWESGVTQPSTKHLILVARALSVPIDRILVPSAKTRERIIEAATRLFDRIGYDETSIEVVAATADVTLGEFQALFESKSELLYAVLSTYNDRTFEDLRRIPPRFGTVDARLKYLLRMYYVHDLAHIRLTAAFHAYSWQWSESRERENVRQLSDHHDTVISLLEEAADHGEIAHGNFRATSHAIFAIYTYSLRRAVYDKLDADALVSAIEPQLALQLKGLGWKAAPTPPTAK